ncbi:MAG: histidine phosphatase family protein [Ruminococcaceae bacterium]|nr:histidine phosphatase family protein [Oscillospiraceae bacterium]
MLFFYIRHGDPIYSPDSLTPLGEKQADAVAKRLALFGLDKIYSSTSNRAMQTAQPTCNLLRMEPEPLDFANEKYPWQNFTVPMGERVTWAFSHPTIRRLFHDPSVRQLGDEWYEHSELKQYSFREGVERTYRQADAFFASLGYEHIRHTGTYRVVKPNEQRVALFAHQGFGLIFLSCLLDIPYPIFCTQFDMCHSGMTVIRFQDEDGICIPKICTLSSDAHLYREGLPTNYNYEFRF